MRIKIYPVSSTHPLFQTLLHRRPHNCFSILEVHLSEFVLFRPLPACSIFHLFTKGEVNIPIAESMLVSIPDVSCVTPFPEAFFPSAVWPQNFHSIVTPNKYPNDKSFRPVQSSLLPKVSFVENEKPAGCFDIWALSLPSLISPNKEQKNTGCFFH